MMFASSTWDASKIPDLQGRVAIVTGGNTGLGLAMVKELARHGAKVYMLCRTESRAQESIDLVKKLIPGADVEYIQFDLLSMKTAKEAAETFLRRESRLDILINNAAVMGTPYRLSPDGIEEQACNGTGHFALTISLLCVLKETASKSNNRVRIVNVSSRGYELAQKPDFKSLEGLNQPCTSTWNRYGNSKLSLMLFTNHLQQHLEGTGIYCLTTHPGLIPNTELMRGLAQSWPIVKALSIFTPLVAWMFASPETGALAQLYAATSPEVEQKDLKAAYIIPGPKPGKKTSLGEDPELATDFWNLCHKLLAEKSHRNNPL